MGKRGTPSLESSKNLYVMTVPMGGARPGSAIGTRRPLLALPSPPKGLEGGAAALLRARREAVAELGDGAARSGAAGAAAPRAAAPAGVASVDSETSAAREAIALVRSRTRTATGGSSGAAAAAVDSAGLGRYAKVIAECEARARAALEGGSALGESAVGGSGSGGGSSSGGGGGGGLAGGARLRGGLRDALTFSRADGGGAVAADAGAAPPNKYLLAARARAAGRPTGPPSSPILSAAHESDAGGVSGLDLDDALREE